MQVAFRLTEHNRRGQDARIAEPRGARNVGCHAQQHTNVESPVGSVDGLGWLDAITEFEAVKVTRRRSGRGLGQPVTGYQIHHGRTRSAGGWIELEGAELDGAEGHGVLGTSLHGLFEEDGFRGAFLAEVAARRGKDWNGGGGSFSAERERRFDRLADLLEAHLDIERLLGIVSEGVWEAAPMSEVTHD